VQTLSLVKVLRALELLDGLDVALPASVVLPLAELERERRRGRKRARGRGDEQTPPWRWGDEPQERA
jgi:hypothetical protein